MVNSIIYVNNNSLSTLPNSFNQIFELFKGIRDPRFIFHLERGLKMLDENGKEV